MKRRFSKIAAIVLTFALIMSVAAISVSAYGYTGQSTDKTEFTKYLIVNEDAKVPAIEFEYSIAAGTAITADPANDVMEVLAGVGTPSISKATFTEGESTSTSTTGEALTLGSNQKFAKKTVTVNFENVEFPEPGIYRYVITETSSGQQGITYDTQLNNQKTRVLDVYVVDNGSGVLSISQYVLLKDANTVKTTDQDNGSAKYVDSNGSDVDTTGKSQSIVNEFTTKNIEFGKEVTGNQGSKDKYFKFTLAITGAQANMTYNVDVTTSAEENPTKTTATKYDSMSNPSTITVDDDGNATVTFYLKDGQYIKVKGLPKDTSYNLTEDAEDYKSTKGITTAVSGKTQAYSADTEGTIVNDDVYIGYTNTREGVIPTGVLLTIAPFAIGLLLFGAVAFFLISKRRREDY